MLAPSIDRAVEPVKARGERLAGSRAAAGRAATAGVAVPAGGVVGGPGWLNPLTTGAAWVVAVGAPGTARGDVASGAAPPARRGGGASRGARPATPRPAGAAGEQVQELDLVAPLQLDGVQGLVVAGHVGEALLGGGPELGDERPRPRHRGPRPTLA